MLHDGSNADLTGGSDPNSGVGPINSIYFAYEFLLSTELLSDCSLQFSGSGNIYFARNSTSGLPGKMVEPFSGHLAAGLRTTDLMAPMEKTSQRLCLKRLVDGSHRLCWRRLVEGSAGKD